ncbi:sulfite exporter TauE/SafE family protein [Lactiplantibacillus plantarum]|uniref:Probable membrane transporter protein n=1 Tax=Lactiplantibacillus plantarum (strain ATCC BAA-793 / NCIMB 8826 / WCFS1) TaxID=220668 RepID=F9UN49_LACPL|nr:sulfite exporter TauE/SafE family protein [Lactiplantibacillus plantarum]MCG0724359.1 Anion exporter, TauE/SafE family [Lactiplantibacillus plantarum]MDE4415953.1 sulfite exporter TauE/SafE family protein [Lactiplantibacillus plantarum]MDE4416943.1 sulfite exporter TauE/SafE family protein [Lactiplantibacillus plantarum]MDE4421879.1 sulfite exporter TauE/SafE family protein [Lactiplantibacillus plantarum]MDE4424280.1 sulfite exporter TauE/SafE family protein [Lactiplantibacillus plantarum]
MIYSLGLMLGVGVIAGIFGAILGIGGGMIVTPILTLGLGLDIKYAIGASIIAVIATSSGSTIAYLRDEMLNLRVAMFLEIATTVGAVLGAVLTGVLNATFLYFLFGALLVFTTYNMIRKLMSKNGELPSVKDDKLATQLNLNGTYYDKALNKQVDYQVENVPGGFSMMFGAGFASGLLGIGSGAFKVLAMDTIMHMPLKPSSATSNLMMGVTAAASAMIYFFNGSIKPGIAAPLAIGIIVGALIGSRIMTRLKPRLIRMIFVPVMLYLGIQMIAKGFGVTI